MQLTEAQRAIVDSYMNKFKKDFQTVANEVNELYFKQANKMYDSFIKQYYRYPTTSYIRHWEMRPGTRSGSNLYYGKRFKIHRGKFPYFEINLDASQMANDYQHDSATQVLENVINGIRGVPPYWVEPWYGTYKSRYFYYQGDPAHAFRVFIDDYDTMMYPIFMRRWKKLGWE